MKVAAHAQPVGSVVPASCDEFQVQMVWLAVDSGYCAPDLAAFRTNLITDGWGLRGTPVRNRSGDHGVGTFPPTIFVPF